MKHPKLKTIFLTAALVCLLCGCSNNIMHPMSDLDELNTPDTPAVTESTQPEVTADTTASFEATESETQVSTQPEITETTEPTVLPETTTASEEPTLPETQAPEEGPTEPESEETPIDPDYLFNTEDDFFFIVNKQCRLPDDYEIETETVQGKFVLEKTAAKYCRDMIAAAHEDGIELKILSSYRTVEYQKNLFERNIKSRMENDGMSYEDALYDTSINIAPPGGSEHNAGLAVDIITQKDWDTYEGFEDTAEFAWLIEHGPEYGFILRYLKTKEDITGYIYEPWHFRYVGVKYAQDVMDSGLCLEEYFELYQIENADFIVPAPN